MGTGRDGAERDWARRGGTGRNDTTRGGAIKACTNTSKSVKQQIEESLPFGVEQTKDGSFPTNLDTPNSMRATRGAEVRYKQKQKQTPVHRGRGGAGRHGEGRDKTGQHGAGRTRLGLLLVLVRARVFCLILFLLTLSCGHQIPYRCEGL